MFQEPSTTHPTSVQSLVIKLSTKIETEAFDGNKIPNIPAFAVLTSLESCLFPSDFVARFEALEKLKVKNKHKRNLMKHDQSLKERR